MDWAGGADRGVLSRDEYLAAWATWHGGTDPADNRLVRGWLTLAYTLARPMLGRSPLLATGLGLAVAVAAVSRRLVEAPVTVELPGGRLTIDWAPGGYILMTGPATHVFTGELAEGLVAP